MEMLRWILGIIFLLIGMYIISAGIFVRFYLAKKTKKFYSAIPLGGTPWILLGLVISPTPIQWVYLSVLVFDIDWWITAIGLPYSIIQGQFKDQKPPSKS
jgi:uncharacterized SAM-binding protein YcdF (DUF218 family)